MGSTQFDTDAMVAQLDDSDDPEPVGLSKGASCPEAECEQSVHELHHERDPQLGADPHDSYSEFEYVCLHHGIVATH